MGGSKYLKRLGAWLLLLGCLCACGSSGAETVPVVQNYAVTLSENPTGAGLYLAGNGASAVGAVSWGSGDSADSRVFSLPVEDGSVVPAARANMPELTSFQLLGLDADNSLWVSGLEDSGAYVLLQLETDGSCRTRIDLSAQQEVLQVTSFATDGQYLYLTVTFGQQTHLSTQNFRQCLLLYTAGGTLLETKDFSDLSAQT